MSAGDEVVIRPFRDEDGEALWPILREVIRPGDTYAIDPGLNRDRMLDLWTVQARACFVAELDGEIIGTYYIKSNQAGGGAHVCNCGYMTAPGARGKGIARAMCMHSQIEAVKLGYKAMQFNLVVCTNRAATRLWTSLGFETVGRLPRAFDHPDEGLVDALVMYKWLGEAPAG